MALFATFPNDSLRLEWLWHCEQHLGTEALELREELDYGRPN
jgi:hypothetical protein